MLPASFYKNNRQKLFGSCNVDCIVIAAAGLLQRNSDSAFPFRQDSNFLYLTGCKDPDILLVITKNKHYIVLPKREAHRDIWEGEVPATELIATSGVDGVLQYKEGWQFIDQMVAVKRVGAIFPSKKYVAAYGMYTNPTRRLLYDKLKRKNAQKLVDIRMHLARLRSIKTDKEVAIISDAIAITASSLDAVMQQRSSAKFEYDFEHILTYEILHRGADGHSFSPIIATDKNAAIIHNISNKSSLQYAKTVLFDIGAELHGYAADISRVYALKKPSDRFTQVFNAVVDVQQQIIAYAKPGLTLRELEHKTESLLSTKLESLGLNGPVRQYYPHGVSHHLGLDVHDAADYKQPLAKGMVITVEPGLYLPDEHIGVRIEDDILITDTGTQNLSAKVPQDLLYYM